MTTNITLVAARELGDPERHRWRELIGTDARFRSPFVTPHFAVVIGEQRPNSKVAVLEDGPQIVGFLPYQRDRERVALPIGWPMNDAQALVAPPDLEWDMPRLVRQLGARVWRFDHLLAGQSALTSYVQAWHASPTIDLSGGTDSTREPSSGVFRKRTATKRRKLDREVGPVTFEWHSTDPRLLDTLIQWKVRQYERTEVENLFDVQWASGALHAFQQSRDPECSGVLSVLRAGDHLVGLHFGLARGAVLHSWFPAYDPAYSSYSPGLIQMLDLVTAAPDHGITLIDLGRGDQEYKRRVANDEYLVGDGSVLAHGSGYRAAILARHPGWLVRRLRPRPGPAV